MFFARFCLSLTVAISLSSLVCCTTFSTTGTPTSPPATEVLTTQPKGSCEWEGQWYPDGTEIGQEDPYKCSKMLCDGGSVAVYDHQCMFNTPPCSGESMRVLGQCCPICINGTTTPTTTPPTTTPPTTIPHGCYYDGKTYREGEDITRDKYNCAGSVCQDGQIIYWDQACAFQTSPCNGVFEKIEGQCCPVCYNTTTSSQTTTPTSKNVSTTTRTTEVAECFINGTKYFNGQRTNTDPCVKCTCRDDREMCIDVKCQAVLDCDVRYRPYGTCCLICGSSKLDTTFTWLLLVVTVLIRMFR